jgi:hypothetical protein
VIRSGGPAASPAFHFLAERSEHENETG